MIFIHILWPSIDLSSPHIANMIIPCLSYLCVISCLGTHNDVCSGNTRPLSELMIEEHLKIKQLYSPQSSWITVWLGKSNWAPKRHFNFSLSLVCVFSLYSNCLNQGWMTVSKVYTITFCIEKKASFKKCFCKQISKMSILLSSFT